METDEMALTDEQRAEMAEVLVRHATYLDYAATAVDHLAPLIESWLTVAKAVGWEVGYQRGVLDEAGSLELADNPWAEHHDQR